MGWQRFLGLSDSTAKGTKALLNQIDLTKGKKEIFFWFIHPPLWSCSPLQVFPPTPIPCRNCSALFHCYTAVSLCLQFLCFSISIFTFSSTYAFLFFSLLRIFFMLTSNKGVPSQPYAWKYYLFSAHVPLKTLISCTIQQSCQRSVKTNQPVPMERCTGTTSSQLQVLVSIQEGNSTTFISLFLCLCYSTLKTRR